MLLLRGATRNPCGNSRPATFQYMLLLRGATMEFDMTDPDGLFQYMLLLRGATGVDVFHKRFYWFQYMLLLRGATSLQSLPSIFRGFNTCSSCEEQLAGLKYLRDLSVFQYMLLLRGATASAGSSLCSSLVSIHAPLARSNLMGLLHFSFFFCFNTCSSCEEQPSVHLPVFVN